MSNRLTSGEEILMKKNFESKGYKMEWESAVGLYKIIRLNSYRARENDFYTIDRLWKKWDEIKWN